MASDPSPVRTAGPAEDEDGSFIHVFPQWCKGCGICAAECPVDAIEMVEESRVVP